MVFYQKLLLLLLLVALVKSVVLVYSPYTLTWPHFRFADKHLHFC